MYKQMITVLRGTLSQGTEDFNDRHALVILKQQIRDCASQLADAKRAVAVAIAQSDGEAKQLSQIVQKLSELEARAISALENKQSALAQEAAETIAILETERDMSKKAIDQFSAEITRLRRIVQASELKLKDLNRGLKLASATDKTQKLRQSYSNSALTSFSDAQDTLSRLQTRQQDSERTSEILAEMDSQQDPDQLIAKLADAGCGDPITSSADDVLARLKSSLKSNLKPQAKKKSK